jgi:glutamate N-acetyltransferase/amino-acid N-acetyltransferase
MELKPLDIPASYTFAGETVEGGVLAAAGFKAAGVHAGFRANPTRPDLALLVADEPCAVAGVFTTNRFCAAPVTVDREHIAAAGRCRAVVVNSGIANAATGAPGLDNARTTAALVADLVGCTPEEVLVASTGVIGQHLKMDVMRAGLPLVFGALGRDPEDNDLVAARAIMTTDTKPKRAAVRYEDASGRVYTVGGMCKGSGMISPNMATMIAVVTTDAPVSSAALDAALHAAANASFNRVTVDSDTSTNDTCVALASGAAGGEAIELGSGARYEAFADALLAVCDSLARQIAADGEGATKLVRVCVAGAANEADAELAARTVANSPLVKTAVAGHDANWGRIAAALGRSGASFDQYGVDIDILGIPVCRGGLVVDFDEDEALRRFEEPQVDIVCNLGAGDAHATVWTCDLTHEYISINADYRS